MRITTPGILALALLFLRFEAVDGQTVRGTVYQADSDQVVPGASVRLLAEDRTLVRATRSDTTGAFLMQAPAPEWFRLGVDVFGYAPTETEAFFLASGDTLGLEIHVEYSPIALEPLVVNVFNENRAGFERRRGLSYGTRLGPEVLAERGDLSLNEFAARRTPWLEYRSFAGIYTYPPGSKGRTCVPMIFVNTERLMLASGIRPELDRWVDPDEVEAIEVYPNGSTLPSPFFGLARAENDSPGVPPCGVVVVWTKAGFGLQAGTRAPRP